MSPLVGDNQTVPGHGCLHGAGLRHSGTVDTHDLPRIHPHCTHANKCHCESAESVGRPLPAGRGQLQPHKRAHEQFRPAHAGYTARWRHGAHPAATLTPRYLVHALHCVHMHTTCGCSTTTPHGPSLRSRTAVRRSVTAGRCRAGMGAVGGAVIVATATVVTDSHFSLD